MWSVIGLLHLALCREPIATGHCTALIVSNIFCVSMFLFSVESVIMFVLVVSGTTLTSLCQQCRFITPA